MHPRHHPAADLRADQLEDDPHPFLHELRSTAPVCWVGELDGWLVTSRALAIEVMRDAATYTVDDPRFTTAQVIGPSMLSLDGPEHARHREPFGAAFRHQAVRDRLSGYVRRTARSLVASVAGRGAADLRIALSGPLSVRVVARLLGLPPEDAGALRGWYDRIVDGVTDLSAGRRLGEEARQAFAELSAAVQAGIRDGGSLVAEAARALTTDEAVSNAGVILFGGIETTDGAIANLLWHLLTHPDQLAAVQADRALVPRAVEESLRLEPAAARVDRYATRDAELGGATVRAGDLVIVSLSAANRDPQAFTAPDRFDVTRPEATRHVTFAHGPHACVGAELARLEAGAAVEAVLDLLDDPRLDGGRAAAPRGLVFRKPPTLPVRWTPARP